MAVRYARAAGRITVLVGLALAVVACRRSASDSKIDPALIEANLLADEPTVANRVDADLDGKVIYLGNEVDSVNLVPGGGARIVHFWKVVTPPGADWGVFSHLTGAGASEWLNIDYSDMRVGYPPGKWKAGDIIRDEQRFTLPASWTAAYAQVTVGLYRKGASGTAGRMKVAAGPVDSEGRILAYRFKVDPAPDKGGAEYTLRRASGPIVLDGVADEAAWQNAPLGPDFTDAEGGTPVGARTSARLLWDDVNLYAFIQVEDDDVYSSYKGRDDPLWKEDVVELFIDADRNRHGYVELQVNPNGAIFDSYFPRTRSQEHHFEWNSGMAAKVVVHGTADQRGDHDRGWDVEIAIPLTDVKGMDAAMKVNIPPHLGDRWRLNVVRGEKPAKGGLRASSWNPITIQDFHALGRMLTVVFADADGNTVAATPAGAATGAGATGDAGAAAVAPAAAKRAQPRGR
jgi:hypothetical protein